jgi:hypothetical protein
VQARAEKVPSIITVFYRSLTAVARRVEPQHLTVDRLSGKRGWFNCTLPVEPGVDFEWWVEAKALKLRYPRAANSSTVVVVDHTMWT